MRFLYNSIYLLLIAVCSPLILWSAIFPGKYREGFAQKFFGKLKTSAKQGHRIWLHAVSVGEVNLLQTLIDELNTQYDNLDFYITTTTKTGYDLANKKYQSHTVDYCPLDFSWAVHQAFNRIQPDLILLAELELWPNLINHAHRSDVPVCVVNGRLSEKSFSGYQKIKFLMQPLLEKLALVAVQDEAYAKRFIGLGAKSVKVSGSLKFDGAETNRANLKTLELKNLANIPDNAVVFLAGSTQAGEEEAALQTFNKLTSDFPNLHLILVPRHPERFEAVAQLLSSSNHAWSRRSELDSSKGRVESNILLVDTIGELGAWWGTADIAFVGGSLGSRGGQNMIEPAAYGAAVCFGPNTRNFRDIVQLMLSHQAAVVVQDQQELTKFVHSSLADQKYREKLGFKSASLVRTQLGATARTVDMLRPYLPCCQQVKKAA